MQIKTIGHEEEYLLQNLALAFFPSTGFSKENEDGLLLTSTLDGDCAETVLKVNDKVFNFTETKIDRAAPEEGIARSFYNAATEATGIRPPWGTLTGIRPSKKIKTISEQRKGDIEDIMERDFYTLPVKTRLAKAVLNGENRALEQFDEGSASIYIGIPFCPSRCSYCSFAAHTIKEAGAGVASYLEMLKRELVEGAEMLRRSNRRVQTLYIGGGTPTSLTEPQLLDLLTTVRNNFDVENFFEYTVEAGRVDTINAEKLRIIKEQGARRISVNAQSTSDETLKTVGRTHNSAEFFEKYRLAREFDFEAVNVDLIAGLPGEAVGTFENSLQEVLALAPENLTIHTLSLKRAAILSYADMQKSKDDLYALSAMLEHSSEKMACEGYFPYYLYRQRNTLGNLENVGYSREGAECLYNVYTMGEYQSIMAFGAGAVSKVVNLQSGKIERTFNYKHFYEYIRDFEKARGNILTIENLLKYK